MSEQPTTTASSTEVLRSSVANPRRLRLDGNGQPLPTVAENAPNSQAA